MDNTWPPQNAPKAKEHFNKAADKNQPQPADPSQQKEEERRKKPENKLVMPPPPIFRGSRAGHIIVTGSQHQDNQNKPVQTPEEKAAAIKKSLDEKRSTMRQDFSRTAER